MATEELAATAAAAKQDHMPLHGIDHVELYVGNAAQAAYFYEHALGFQEVAYAGLETGRRDRVSHVLEQGRIRLVLTGALGGDDEIGERHRRHGDGVKVIALCVPDAAAAYRHAVEHGARGVREPLGRGRPRPRAARPRSPPTARRGTRSSSATSYRGAFLPGYERARRGPPESGRPACCGIDHVVGNVELGHMEEWVAFYERVFGMTEMIHFSDEAISTEYSALMSKVVTDGNGRIKFPINEPAEGKRKSQIDEYLEFYGGAGAQHIAVCDDATS